MVNDNTRYIKVTTKVRKIVAQSPLNANNIKLGMIFKIDDKLKRHKKKFYREVLTSSIWKEVSKILHQILKLSNV